MNINIYTVTHKKYKMPSDPMYIPIQSGSALYPNIGYQRDDIGDNISKKNPAFNIMCAMYWVWKNSNADFVGIVHYRRHFSLKKSPKIDFDNVLTKTEAKFLLEKNNILVAPKRFYPFMTIRSHYIYTKGGYINIHKKDIKTLRDVISDVYPDYIVSFDKVMNRTYFLIAKHLVTFQS